MPLQVGIDLVSARSVSESISTFGERYLRRVYTERELTECGSGTAAAPERLAGRFAAKEATLKALRVGEQPVPWRDIEVRSDPGGSVGLTLKGRAATLAAESGVRGLTLSLTREQGLASAVVIAALAYDHPQI